jgi:excisionase family DNA binding protein
MEPSPPRPPFSAFLLVQEAARYLGVSANTLRAWDQQGKLKARRHPLNGYRLYDRGELDELLRSLDEGPAVDRDGSAV